MAEIKVSQLPEASQINDNDLIMIVQGGTNKKITKENCQFASGDEISIGTTEPTGEEKIWIDPTEIPSGIGTDISNVYSDAQDKAYSCHYSNKYFTEGTILYENANGTNADFTLNETIANYKYIQVEYTDNNKDCYRLSNLIPADNCKDNLDIWGGFYDGGIRIVGRTSFLSISGTSATIVSSSRNGYFVITPSGANSQAGNYIYITKVIGYK